MQQPEVGRTWRVSTKNGIDSLSLIADYVKYLKDSERERAILFKELLIGVTSFFRNMEAFDLLKEKFIPDFLDNKPDEYCVRVWVPGCSTGEEVYSLAIILQECMVAMERHFNIQIFGTDIDAEAIDACRAGIYPDSISSDVSPERLKQFFTLKKNRYQIKKMVRETVVFAPQNIIKDPPFTNLDFVSCRNLFIYFSPELQQKIFPLLHYSLKRDGILFLGSSEATGRSSDLFAPLDKKWKLFQRLEVPQINRPVMNLPCVSAAVDFTDKRALDFTREDVKINTQKLLGTIIAQSDMPTCAVIDGQANIVYIHGHTGQFLELPEGETSSNILKMVRPGLLAGLTSALREAATKSKEVVLKGLQVDNSGVPIFVNLIVRPLPDFQSGSRGMMIVFFESVDSAGEALEKVSQPNQPASHADIQRLEDELIRTKENLQTTIEQLETSNEELKSTNEELQSTNEELQSTNEELETSKEELQSLNEESISVNVELTDRIDELVKANDDISNLLAATEIATIFLDINLAVRRFTPKALGVLPLTNADIGRPIKHFAANLIDVDIHSMGLRVLNELGTHEVEVANIEGDTFRMRVRPYRTTNNLIDGVVFTFENITAIKKTESQLVKVSSVFEDQLFMMSKVFMDGADPIIIEGLDGRIIDANDEAVKAYGWNREDLLGKPALTLTPKERHDEVNEILERCRNGKSIRNIEGTRLHKSGEAIPVVVTYSRLSGKDGNLAALATIAKNILQFKKTLKE